MNHFYQKITKSTKLFSEDHVIKVCDGIDWIQDSFAECYTATNLRTVLAKSYNINLESSVGMLLIVFVSQLNHTQLFA